MERSFADAQDDVEKRDTLLQYVLEVKRKWRDSSVAALPLNDPLLTSHLLRNGEEIIMVREKQTLNIQFISQNILNYFEDKFRIY